MVKLALKQLPITSRGDFSLPVLKNYEDPYMKVPTSFALESLESSIKKWHKTLEHFKENPHVRECLRQEEKIGLEKRMTGTLILPFYWKASFAQLENGYVHEFRIEGSNLYIDTHDAGQTISFDTIPEKDLKEFEKTFSPLKEKNGLKVKIYNVSAQNLPQALLLREWGRRFTNKVAYHRLMDY